MRRKKQQTNKKTQENSEKVKQDKKASEDKKRQANEGSKKTNTILARTTNNTCKSYSPQCEHVGLEQYHLHCAGVDHLCQEVRFPREQFDNADAVHRLAHHRHALVPPLDRRLIGDWWLMISGY